MARRGKRPTLAQYERVLELRRSRIPPAGICEIVGLSADDLSSLINDGLPAKKGVHPAQRPIRSVLVEDQAERARNALDWAGAIATAARQTAAERAITAHAAAKIERLLISAWSKVIDVEIRTAQKDRREIDMSKLLPGRDVLFALRTLAKTRDLAPDVRAPMEVYRKRLDEIGKVEQDDDALPPIDPSLFSDLMELDEKGLEYFASTGELPEPKQLELPAASE